MADEREPDTGTPETKDDSELAGTPESTDGGDAGEGEDGKVTISKGELGVWKSKAERVNELEKKLADLEARAESRTTTDTRGSEADQQRAAIQKREAYLQRLEVSARAGNEDAEALLEVHRGALEAEQRTLYRLEMMDVPSDERTDVRSFMKDNGLSSPAIAMQLMRGGSKYQTLAEEVASLRKQLEVKNKPSPKIEGRVVGDRPVASSKTVNGVETITLQEYTERMNDPARRLETKNARNGGKLKIKA